MKKLVKNVKIWQVDSTDNETNSSKQKSNYDFEGQKGIREVNQSRLRSVYVVSSVRLEMHQDLFDVVCQVLKSSQPGDLSSSFFKFEMKLKSIPSTQGP